MDPHFNAALDELRGKGTERALAERLGVSQDTLLRYRRGFLPWGVRQLRLFPALLQALAQDAERLTAEQERDESPQPAALSPGLEGGEPI